MISCKIDNRIAIKIRNQILQAMQIHNPGGNQ